MLITIAKLLAAGACLAAVCWFGGQFFFAAGVPQTTLHRLLGVTVTIAAGAAAFFGASYLLRVAELHDLLAVVQRKLRR
jgi:hypothetical protein